VWFECSDSVDECSFNVVVWLVRPASGAGGINCDRGISELINEKY
jgi:hypothetical protein